MPKNKRTYIFDIDHTLYPYSEAVEMEITGLIDDYLTQELGLPIKEAIDKRQDYYHLFGTTLAGLLYFEEIDACAYLKFKDRFRLEVLGMDEQGLNKVKNSDERKIAVTNSHKNHGIRVLQHLGLFQDFEKVYGIEDMGYWGKPFRKSFDLVFNDAKIEPQNAVFFEDSMRNLAYPKSLGMTTILINDHSVQQGQALEFVDHHVSNLDEAMSIADAL